MAGKNIIDVTDEEFAGVVLESDKLVMVDFWATWCGPCLALGPTMEALAEEYAGRVVVAKLNVDDNRETAAQHRITSIPTVLFFKGGKVVDQVTGSLPKVSSRKSSSDTYNPTLKDPIGKGTNSLAKELAKFSCAFLDTPPLDARMTPAVWH